jgi:hypothetical protein
VKPLTVARLRQMTYALDLPLDDEDLTRLLPMVEDLMAVARRLHHDHPGGMARPDPHAGPTPSSG